MIDFNPIDTKEGGYAPAYYDIEEDDVPVAIKRDFNSDTDYEIEAWEEDHPFQVLITQMNTEYLEKLQALQSEIAKKYDPLFDELVENPSAKFDIRAYTGEADLEDFGYMYYT